MNLKELLKQRVDDGDLLPDLPQGLKDKNTEIVKAYKEGYEQGKKDAERTGRWLPLEGDGYADGAIVYDVWECSNCGNEERGEDVPETNRYCRWCGARMEAE